MRQQKIRQSIWAVLDNFVNIQVPWGKLGLKMTQMMLLAGGNDLAGTMFSDDVSANAGASDAIISIP